MITSRKRKRSKQKIIPTLLITKHQQTLNNLINSIYKNMTRKVLPPTYFYLCIGLIVLAHFIFPIKKIIYYPYNLFGILLIFFGIILNIWAWALFIKNKTTQNPYKTPNKFVVKGIYKITRNPMYLGMLMILFGIAVFLGSLITFIFPIIFFIIINWLFIPIEENNMKQKFGNRYLEYKNKVRRWI